MIITVGLQLGAPLAIEIQEVSTGVGQYNTHVLTDDDFNFIPGTQQNYRADLGTVVQIHLKKWSKNRARGGRDRLVPTVPRLVAFCTGFNEVRSPPRGSHRVEET